MPRAEGRLPGELRPIEIIPNYLPQAEGSALISLGRTWVLCTATVEARVPPFLQNSGQGWITAEYGMLPRATNTRRPREGIWGRVSGRTQEIQRLIGRSLRAVTDLLELGERTIILDCDVLQADGGTRTAAVTGAFVALCQALAGLQRQELLDTLPIRGQVVAVSVGLVDGQILVDLDYQEDSRAAVDANLVVTEQGQLVEIQATGEGGPFAPELLGEMLQIAQTGLKKLCQSQEDAIRPWMHLPW
ncbi:MAG: ribonuclease PH [Deltaproteobacteria bacterium]|nr:ribonuclease PH [Deltaproteobacteria bacterium]MBW1951575.1 ribonuclease PH [Deltaproteobacteria bacterium]MBW1986592.1 ribonuclease PH [Deltaproteobacteria bacterium]MBW2134808.1 ribonuclease PH [Deltaproteobacteria bacterium]